MQRGFTLIELLVVIAIIGLLASIVLASMETARERARDASRAASITNVQLSLELYFEVWGEYPPSGGNRFHGAGQLGEYLVPDFISQMPQDPTSLEKNDNLDYRYAKHSSKDDYAIRRQVESIDTANGWCTASRNGWIPVSWAGDPNCKDI